MSDAMPPMPPGTDGMSGAGQPSEEEMRQALGQMRAAPVEQLVAEILSSTLNQAQVKLGRNDGRLLLDLAAVIADGTRGTVDPELTTQVDEALSQLRIAQVQAEAEVVQAATQGHVEHGDLPSRPTPMELVAKPAEAAAPDGTPAGGAAPSVMLGNAPAQPDPSAASRLWVPGS
jgi:hypothetical protein